MIKQKLQKYLHYCTFSTVTAFNYITLTGKDLNIIHLCRRIYTYDLIWKN